MAFSRYGQGTVRNAAMRDALRAKWPDTKFSVRNAAGAWSSVRWVDGPTQGDVTRALSQVLAPDGYPWGAETHREISDELVAVAHWRAHLAGDVDVYREVDTQSGKTLPAGATPLAGNETMSRRCVEHDIDASTITAEERTTAAAILAVAGALPDGPSRRAAQIARTVTLHGAAVEGILA